VISEPGRSTFEAVGRSALILTGAAAAIQVIGIVRELFIAANVGIAPELDAMLVVLFLPTTLATVVTSGVVRAIVPAYLEARTNAEPAVARRLAGTAIVWVGVAGLVLWAALELLADPVASIAGPGLSASGREASAQYLRLLAPVAFVTTVSNVLSAVCQAEERFGIIAAGLFATPAVTLGTMLLLWHDQGLHSLAVGSLVGPIATFVVLVAATAWSRSVTLVIPRADDRVRALVRHAWPLTAGAAILQINVIGDRAIASLLAPGAVSALRYADVLVRVPLGAIAPAWGSAIYPTLVNSSLGALRATLAEASELAMRFVMVVFVPVAMLTAAVAPIAVAIAYGRGAFTISDTDLTARTVAAFAPLLVTSMLVPILTGAHNARRRGQLLLVGATLNVVLNITLDVVLGRLMGAPGVALASSFAEASVAILFIRRLARSEDGFSTRPFARATGLALLAGIPVGLVVAAISWTGAFPRELLPALLMLIAVGLFGMAGYAVVASRVGLHEPGALITLLASRFLRRHQTVQGS
jgi:putative peptidoglycan lipid II flippase